MDLSEILLSIVAAAATLTPLILGLLKYFGDKKKHPEPPAPAVVPVLGDTVDFESVAVTALNRHIELLTDSHRDLTARVAKAEAERDRADDALERAREALERARDTLRAAGLLLP